MTLDLRGKWTTEKELYELLVEALKKGEFPDEIIITMKQQASFMNNQPKEFRQPGITIMKVYQTKLGDVRVLTDWGEDFGGIRK